MTKRGPTAIPHRLGGLWTRWKVLGPGLGHSWPTTLPRVSYQIPLRAACKHGRWPELPEPRAAYKYDGQRLQHPVAITNCIKFTFAFLQIALTWTHSHNHCQQYLRTFIPAPHCEFYTLCLVPAIPSLLILLYYFLVMILVQVNCVLPCLHIAWLLPVFCLTFWICLPVVEMKLLTSTVTFSVNWHWAELMAGWLWLRS